MFVQTQKVVCTAAKEWTEQTDGRCETQQQEGPCGLLGRSQATQMKASRVLDHFHSNAPYPSATLSCRCLGPSADTSRSTHAHCPVRSSELRRALILHKRKQRQARQRHRWFVQPASRGPLDDAESQQTKQSLYPPVWLGMTVAASLRDPCRIGKERHGFGSWVFAYLGCRSSIQGLVCPFACEPSRFHTRTCSVFKLHCSALQPSCFSRCSCLFLLLSTAWPVSPGDPPQLRDGREECLDCSPCANHRP